MKILSSTKAIDTDFSPETKLDSKFIRLCERGFSLPLPAQGATLGRWRTFAKVAASDLSTAKLFESHADALAILAELQGFTPVPNSRWGVWAAESGTERVQMRRINVDTVQLYGRKSWCSGAPFLTHALITAWEAERGPYLVAMPLHQERLRISNKNWQAVGMADTATCDVSFYAAEGRLIGSEKDYLTRAGFWQGAAGIAACWYGAAQAIAIKLFEYLRSQPSRCDAHALAHLGSINIALQQSAALMRSTAQWIDQNPIADAEMPALQLRSCVEANANQLMEHVGRSVGAAPYCNDAQFARLAADLPVFLRQNHAERDLAQLGRQFLQTADAEAPLWNL